MKLTSLLLLAASLSPAATLFLGAYPNSVLVFDEARGQIVDRIPLETGLPRNMRLSQDGKLIYVYTLDHNGIEIIDVATRKVINHFVLDTPAKRYRFAEGGALDPENKLLYTVTTEIDKQMDHYDIGRPKYTVIDVAGQKISRTVDMPREEENGARAYGHGAGFEISPDGKYLYEFRDRVVILNSSDFKVVDRLDLSKPEVPGQEMESVGFGGELDSISEPGQHISLFNSSDGIIHNRVFGIARFDLTTRHVDYTPVGPSVQGMSNLEVTPDRKQAYTVVTTGQHGGKRCEFWAFDLPANRITQTTEFPCRARFSFGMSGDGKKLYVYAAGFEIEVYDAATLKYERTWDLNNDLTGPMVVVR
jgi:DNA-binding beta-propeller fold protein YncE